MLAHTDVGMGDRALDVDASQTVPLQHGTAAPMTKER